MSTPVTEGEVSTLQNFFDRISSTIVAHSAQVRELAELRQRMNEIDTSLARLTDESSKLRADLSSAWQAYEQVKAEKDKAQAELEIQARDAMAARTETVNVRQEFEQKLGVANDQIHARDEQIAELEDRLTALRQGQKDWQERSYRYENLAKGAEDKLAIVQGKLDDIYTMFKPKEPTQATAQLWKPDPVAENAGQRVINF